MGIKVTEWRLRMSENILSLLGKVDSSFEKSKGKAKDFQNVLNGDKFGAFSSEIPALNRGLSVMSSGYMLAGASVAALGAGMYKSAEMALDYETAMAKVNATAQLTPEQLALLKNELIEIGETSAGNFTRIPDAFERINSQVNNTTKSLEILKVANKGAQAGFVDIDLAAGALAQTLSIIGGKDDAGGVMDTLLKAKKTGAGEFKDFAQYLPQLIASGDNLNIGYKDVAGLFSYMTAKGQSATDASMLMQNMFTAMGKSEIQQGLAKQGIHLFDKEGNVKDLGVFFKELNEKTKKFTAEGKSNFLETVGLRDAQAKNAFSVLAGDADKLNGVLSEVRNSVGELNNQLDTTGNRARGWAEIGDKMKSAMLSVGDWLLPIVDKLIWGAENLIRIYSGKNNLESQGDFDIARRTKDEKLARAWAEGKVKEQFPAYGPAMFENKGQKLEGKAKELYNYSYNWDMAKLAGDFGGDYDKFIADTKAASKPKGKTLAETFNLPDKKGKKSNLKDGIEGINEGGRSIRNINVSFKNLVEKIEIKPQTLKEGTQDIISELEEMLVRAVSGAEESLTNE